MQFSYLVFALLMAAPDWRKSARIFPSDIDALPLWALTNGPAPGPDEFARREAETTREATAVGLKGRSFRALVSDVLLAEYDFNRERFQVIAGFRSPLLLGTGFTVDVDAQQGLGLASARFWRAGSAVALGEPGPGRSDGAWQVTPIRAWIPMAPNEARDWRRRQAVEDVGNRLWTTGLSLEVQFRVLSVYRGHHDELIARTAIEAFRIFDNLTNRYLSCSEMPDASCSYPAEKELPPIDFAPVAAEDAAKAGWLAGPPPRGSDWDTEVDWADKSDIKRAYYERITELEEAIRLAPSLIVARYYLACTLSLVHERGRAIAVLEQIKAANCTMCLLLLAMIPKDPFCDWSDPLYSSIVKGIKRLAHFDAAERVAAGLARRDFKAFANHVADTHEIELIISYGENGPPFKVALNSRKDVAAFIRQLGKDYEVRIPERMICNEQCCHFEAEYLSHGALSLSTVCFALEEVPKITRIELQGG